MQSPVDYPLNDSAHNAEFSMDELSYAAMLDRMDSSTTDTDMPIVDAPVFDVDESDRPATSDQLLLKPFTVFTQSLLARDHNAADLNPLFSRWSRVLR